MRLQYVSCGAIDRRVAATTFLIGRRSRIAEARQDEPGLDSMQVGLVARQPREGADGAGDEHETVRAAEADTAQDLAEERRHRDAGQVVVGK